MTVLNSHITIMSDQQKQRVGFKTTFLLFTPFNRFLLNFTVSFLQHVKKKKIHNTAAIQESQQTTLCEVNNQAKTAREDNDGEVGGGDDYVKDEDGTIEANSRAPAWSEPGVM